MSDLPEIVSAALGAGFCLRLATVAVGVLGRLFASIVRTP